MLISERILHLRKKNNLTQKEFARKLNINQSMVVHLEKGKPPSPNLVSSMCKVFDVDRNYFYALHPFPFDEKETELFLKDFSALPRSDQDFLSLMLRKLVISNRLGTAAGPGKKEKGKTRTVSPERPSKKSVKDI